MHHISSNYLLRSFTILVLTMLSMGCHPPIGNYLLHAQQSTQSWIGASAAELVLLKGNPQEVRYLGMDNRNLVEQQTKTYDSTHFDRKWYDLNTTQKADHQHKIHKNLKDLSNSKFQGVWLFVYYTHVRSYRSNLRDCTNFYLIGTKAQVIYAGISSTNINDYKHCPVTQVRPGIKDLISHMNSEIR